MPRIDADGVELFCESLGEGTPLILQGHDHTPWLFFQAPVFSQSYRFITFDRRGTGRSASPDGEWSVADFARDLRASWGATAYCTRALHPTCWLSGTEAPTSASLG